MQTVASKKKTSFIYKDKEGNATPLHKMSTEQLQAELEVTRRRKTNIEFVERKLETELMKRLKNEPTPNQIILKTENRAIA